VPREGTLIRAKHLIVPGYLPASITTIVSNDENARRALLRRKSMPILIDDRDSPSEAVLPRIYCPLNNPDVLYGVRCSDRVKIKLALMAAIVPHSAVA